MLRAWTVLGNRLQRSQPKDLFVTQNGIAMDDLDQETLEALCAGFQREWVVLLRDRLARHHIPIEVAKSICGEFSFDLSMLFDQGEIEVEGVLYRPFVAFTDDGDEPRLVIEPNGSEFHEYALGTTDEAYEGK